MPHSGSPIPAAKRQAAALAFAFITTAAGVAGAAVPPPAILVLALGGEEGAAPPPSLVEALQIQMAGVAVVVTAPGPAAPSGTDRARAAASLVAGAGAVLGVWVERGAGPPPVALLHVVGAGEPELVDPCPFPGEASPALDRALALKVREILDTLRPPASSPVHETAPATAPVRPPKGALVASASPPASAPAERSLTITPVLEVFLAAAAPAGSLAAQVAGGAGFALRLTRGPWIGELHLDVSVGAPQERSSPSGRVDLHEVRAASGLRGLVSARRVGVGLALDGGVRFVHARGTTPAGASGAAWRAVPVLRPGVLVRAALTDRVDLRVEVDLELMPARLSFAVNDRTVADLGWLRASGVLSVAVSLQ